MTFTTDWRRQFAALPHRLAGAPIIDLNQRLQQIEKNLQNVREASACFVQEKDSVQFSLCYFSLLDAGFLPIPVSPDIPEAQKKIFGERYPDALWWNNGVLENEVGASGSSLVYKNAYACLTSGTTSLPKLCYLSVDGAIQNAKAHAASFGLQKGMLLGQCLPVYHSFGLVCYLWTSLLHEIAIDFNPLAPTLATLAQRYDEHSVLYLSPSQLRFFARTKNRPTPKAGIVSIGGGAIASHEVALLKDIFPLSRCLVSYGLTEAGPRVSTGEARETSQGSFIGKAMPGIELFVLNEKSELQKEGEGLLCILSPSLKLNIAPEEAIRPGVLRTRDQVLLKNQEITFLGRADDLIKMGGVSIYPADIENAARKLVGVVDCIVLKHRHPLYEEIPVLFVEGTADQDILLDQLNEILPPTQVPQQIFILPKLPRQSLNKIDRCELLKILETL